MGNAEAAKSKKDSASGSNSTGKKSAYMWHDEDHYMLTQLKEDGKDTLARLLPRQGEDEDET